MQIYVHKNNQQLGPFTEAEVRMQLAAGTISLQDPVWWQGQATWLPLGQTSLVTPAVPGAPFIPPASTVPLGSLPAAHRGSSQLAIWSLVCGCISFLCGFFTAVPAVVLGHISLSEIRRNPGMEGRGMAMAGLIIGYIFVGIYVVIIGCGIIIAALGNNVTDVFKSIDSQLNAPQSTTNADDSSSTNSDSTTNTPDPSTNNAPATPDSSTNATPTKLDGQ